MTSKEARCSLVHTTKGDPCLSEVWLKDLDSAYRWGIDMKGSTNGWFTDYYAVEWQVLTATVLGDCC